MSTPLIIILTPSNVFSGFQCMDPKLWSRRFRFREQDSFDILKTLNIDDQVLYSLRLQHLVWVCLRGVYTGNPLLYCLTPSFP